MSMYKASVPVFAQMLTNLSAILDKAAAHAAAKRFDSANFLGMRLIADMLPFNRQVQIACDTAKGAVGRLAGVEIPKHEDTEQTFQELKARIAKTINERYPSTAHASDPGAVVLCQPASDPNKSVTQFLAEVGLLEIKPDQPARVIINERTGTVVAGDGIGFVVEDFGCHELLSVVDQDETIDAAGDQPAMMLDGERPFVFHVQSP